MNPQYLSDGVQRALSAIKALAGQEANGLSPGQLAERLETSPSNATRVLANLQAAGFVEEHPRNPGRYRLGRALVSIANSVELSLSAAAKALAQDQQHYSRVI